MTKQIEIPGAGRKRIPSLERVCETLIEARNAKKEAVLAEKEAAEAAQSLLAKHDLLSYVYVDGELEFLVCRETTEKTKVAELHKKRRIPDEVEA